PPLPPAEEGALRAPPARLPVAGTLPRLSARARGQYLADIELDGIRHGSALPPPSRSWHLRRRGARPPAHCSAGYPPRGRSPPASRRRLQAVARAPRVRTCRCTSTTSSRCPILQT